MIVKNIQTKTNDVDSHGRVIIAINAIGNEDADGDISLTGSFNKTLENDFDRLKWFLNHNTNILLGVPVEGKEEDNMVKMTAQFNMKKQISLDTYEDYKLYAEYGKTLEHSVGVNAIRRNKSNRKEVEEWKLWEFSTLTNWGANANTPLLDIKGMNKNEAEEHIRFLEKALSMKYSDTKLKGLEQSINMIRKAVVGEEIVRCPCCGLVFDYNSVPEQTLEHRVADVVNRYAGWLIDDIAYEEVQKLEETIRGEVMGIIQSKKSLESILNHVRCPKCYGMVSREDTVLKKNKVKYDLKSIVGKIK